MPEKLKEFLKSLSDEEADALWEWLDGDPEALFDIIDLLVKEHPGIG